MIELLGGVFIASLLGSLHCAGMCGGFVGMCSGLGAGRSTLGQCGYHGGRLVSYLALGVLFGAAGAGVDQAGQQFGWPRIAALISGIFILAWGSVALLRACGVRIPRLFGGGALARLLAPAFKRAARISPLPKGLIFGLLTTLLPCGWLYAFALVAAARGSAFDGVLVMGAFWLGTVPILVAVGTGVHLFAARLGRVIPKLTAVALLLTGLLTVSGRLDRIAGSAELMRAAHPTRTARAAGASDNATVLPTPERISCCHE